MAQSSFKVTETRSTISVKNSKLDIQPVLSNPLPQAPLMSFDLHFDTLKVIKTQDYLNNVTNIVNHQGTVIKSVIEELNKRVTSTEIIEIFSSLSNVFPPELGRINFNRSGDEWKDTISLSIQKFANLNERVVDLMRFKTATQENLQAVDVSLKQKADVLAMKTKFKKVKRTLSEEVKSKSEMILNHMKEEDDLLAGRINELFKVLAELEQKTLWKLKDCEDLLKVRVNEKYVLDAINGLEEKLKKNLEDMNRGSLSKLERQIKELEKGLEKAQIDLNTKIKIFKDDLLEGVNKRTPQPDHDNLKKEVETLSKVLKSFQDSNILNKIAENSSKIQKVDDSLKSLQSKITDDNLSEEFENLRGLVDQLKYELDKKADKNLVADMYSKANEPKADQAQEKYDFNEFWKFREKTMEQLRLIEIRLEKLSKSAELSNIKKILSQKANEEDVKTEFSSHDFKLVELDRASNQHAKDIESISLMLKKLNSSFSEFSQQSGLALLGRKQTPQICLSCGRGDTNFAPIQAQVMGRDGKVYKADVSTGKNGFGKFDEGFETGVEVFAMDTHEHAHFRRWEEHDTSFKDAREVRKIPLNVILGKEARKSNSVLQITSKNRPSSAKK